MPEIPEVTSLAQLRLTRTESDACEIRKRAVLVRMEKEIQS